MKINVTFEANIKQKRQLWDLLLVLMWVEVPLR